MSSKYPILADRPIDQWKVTELKEELKRRKLAIKGLKDDLIKRLDEALRAEMEDAEASEKDEANVFNSNVAGLKDSQTVTVVAEVVDIIPKESGETVETAEKGNTGLVEPIETEDAEKLPEVVDNDSNKSEKLDSVTVLVDINSTVPAVNKEVEHVDFSAGVNSANVGEEINVHASTMETTITVTESASTEVVVGGQDSYSAEQLKDYGNSVIKQENGDSEAQLDNVDSKPQLDNEESKPQLECDLKLPCEDPMPNSSSPENQVSEVNRSLGSQVKYESISTNYVSFNQKNELKDTIIAENVNLEQYIVRPEMVEEPSSRNDIPVYDESHSMDVEELHEKKASVEENSSNNKSPDLNKINSSEDFGYPEKLNLDRSSGDDSMEEDLPENKQFDSKFNIDELRDKGERVEVLVENDEGSTVVVGDGLCVGKGDTNQDDDTPPVSLVEKRKFRDQASVENNEPAKRQRRWNSETVKVSGARSPTLRPVTTPEDEPIAFKRNFSRSDSSAMDNAPKERVVPASQRAPTDSLKIDRFLRPFTLKAVQELLGKTGNVINFWMDQIKTHCYVTYSSVEEAIETRNALYNLQWPQNGGRFLVAEYVDPQEVKMKLEPPPTRVTYVNRDSTVPPITPTSQPEPSLHLQKDWPPAPVTLPPPPPLSKPPPTAAREWLPSPQPLPEKVDQPIVTLDDIFRKTKATPRIYYLPLSEEQVAAKLAAQGRSIKQY